MIVVDVTIEDRRWREAVPEAEVLCRRAAAAAFSAVDLGGRSVEISVLLTDDETMRRLNREHRGKDQATNVLSFAGEPLSGPPRGETTLLGDIVLARQTVVAEAATAGIPTSAHVAHMIVHGMLHLLGYDHRQDDEAATMEAIEVRILAGLGVADPYRADAATAGVGV